MLQQVTVVARHLDDQRLRAETEPVNGVADKKSLGVLHPAVGERREVRVLGEGVLRRDQRRDLQQQAPFAEPEMQRERRLGRIEVIGAQEPLTGRRRSQVENTDEPIQTT